MKSERRARSIKKTTECIRLFLSFWALFFYPFPSFTLFLTLAVFLLWWFLSLLFFLIPFLSLCLPVLLLSVQPDRTLIHSVDATQFCTVQCTAILLQWTPLSWYIHKTPLCSEWNVPTRRRGALLEWFILWGGSYHLSSSVGWWKGGREMQRWKAVYEELNLGRWIYIVKIIMKYLIAWNAYFVHCRWCC